MSRSNFKAKNKKNKGFIQDSKNTKKFMSGKSNAVPITAFSILLAFIIFTAFNPAYRVPWILETVVVLAFVLVLALTYRKFRFSNTSYVLMALFLFLPMIGAYFSFGEVPFGKLLDFSGAGRNSYDRLVHFLFGLMISVPLFELLIKRAGMKKKSILPYLITIGLIFGAGAIYEVSEWSSALIFSPEDVAIFVGLGGDEWDPQKDMLLAGIGSIITMIFMFFYNIK